MTTIKDISDSCGLSVSTVSKALNGYGDINSDTRAKVLETAKKLNYIPHGPGKTDILHRTYMIGVVCEVGYANRFFSEVLEGARQEAAKNGYSLVLMDEDQVNCDGVLILNGHFSNHEKKPVVYSERDRSFLQENYNGTLELTRRYISNGIRKIAFIHGEDSNVTQKRIEGYRDALTFAGIEWRKEYEIGSFYYDINAAESATTTLVALEDAPEAILYPDDICCLSGIRTLRSYGFRDPKVAGFGGTKEASMSVHGFVSYPLDTFGLGRNAVEKLLGKISK